MAAVSIWKDIDRNAFYKALESRGNHAHWKTDRIASASWASLEHQCSQSYPFPFETESDLAQSLAFLAAWKSDPSYVAAASVSPGPAGRGLIVTLAANEGISPEVRQTFERLLVILERCASDLPTSRQTCAAECLGIVAGLHTFRILNRISFKNRGKVISVAARLTEMSAKLRTYPPAKKADALLFACQIDTLVEAIRRVEVTSRAGELSGLLVTVMETAYDISTNCIPLAQGLKTLGNQKNGQQPREIRAVLALAKYKSICMHLCESARSYRGSFFRMDLNIVDSDWSETRPCQSGGYKLFVHAEIQLLVYHEHNCGTRRKPRTIAASKRACFMCAAFISSFGSYAVQSSHGEIYRQWTIPDRPDYGTDLCQQINESLKQTLSLVLKAKRMPTQTVPQSVINLVMNTLRPPSVETICSALSRKSLTGHVDGSFLQPDKVPTPPLIQRANKCKSSSLIKLDDDSRSDGMTSKTAGEQYDWASESLGQSGKVEDTTVSSDGNSNVLVSTDYIRQTRPIRSVSHLAAMPALSMAIKPSQVSDTTCSPPRHDSLQPEINYVDHTTAGNHRLNRCEVSYDMERPWLILHAGMDGEPLNDAREDSSLLGQYSGAFCSITRHNAQDVPHHVVHLDDVDKVLETRLERADDAEHLSFVLKRADHEDLMIRVEWRHRIEP